MARAFWVPRAVYMAARLGLLAETGPQAFALTPLSATLKTGAPGAARATVMALAGQWMWLPCMHGSAWRKLPS